MASWIVHLRIAEILLGQIPGLDAEKFAVGNIAPDSGIPDEKWENFTPSTQVTHFEYPAGPYCGCADLEFYRCYLLPLRAAPDPLIFSFRLGYFCHLVTDNLWRERIGRPTQVRWSEQFAADKDFIWEVKKDWYGLDFIYLRDHPDSLFWRVFLIARPETGGLDFLPLDAVCQRVEYIQQYYQRTDEEVQKAYNRPYIYLSGEEMTRFVEESSRQFFRIFKHLWIHGASADKATSLLELDF